MKIEFSTTAVAVTMGVEREKKKDKISLVIGCCCC
jgi:hypothetical protein